MQLLAGSSTVPWPVPEGLHMDGYSSRTEQNQGFRDPLMVKALVLDDTVHKILLVNVEAIGVELNLTRKFRKMASSRWNIPLEHIMVTATHTHAGPRGIRLGVNPLDGELRGLLLETMLVATEQAFSSIKPAETKVGTGYVAHLSQNRRNPEWPNDPRVYVVGIFDEDKAPICILINYACHPTVLTGDNLLYSSDYPGAVARSVMGAVGGDTTVMFLTGACGDINPTRVDPSFQEVERFGLILGGEVVRIVGELLAAEEDPKADNIRWMEKTLGPRMPGRAASPKLGGHIVEISLELKDFPPLDSYGEYLEKLGSFASDTKDMALWSCRETAAHLTEKQAEAGSAKMVQYCYQPGQKEVSTELQMIVFDDRLALLGFPGEVFNAIGRFAQANWCGELMVAGYTNDYVGYLCTKEAYSQGGYEAGRTLFQDTTEERLKVSVRKLLGNCQAD